MTGPYFQRFEVFESADEEGERVYFVLIRVAEIKVGKMQCFDRRRAFEPVVSFQLRSSGSVEKVSLRLQIEHGETRIGEDR